MVRLGRRPGCWLAIGLVAGLLIASADPAPAQEEAPAAAAPSFSTMLEDDAWGLTSWQWRLLAASGVVLGLIGFATLASFVVVRLAERRRVSDPPCVLDLMPLSHRDRRGP